MLSTGLDELDRELGGGLPPGSVLALTAPPDSQSELLLEGLARANEATYVTTVREAAAVADRLPERTVREATSEDLLFDPETYLEVPEGGCLVVDAVTRLERDPDTYDDFLAVAARRSRDADGVVALHAHESAEEPPERWLTLARADLTWRLSLAVEAGAVESRLAVTKNRHGAAPTEPLALRLTDRVAVAADRRD